MPLSRNSACFHTFRLPFAISTGKMNTFGGVLATKGPNSLKKANWAYVSRETCQASSSIERNAGLQDAKQAGRLRKTRACKASSKQAGCAKRKLPGRLVTQNADLPSRRTDCAGRRTDQTAGWLRRTRNLAGGHTSAKTQQCMLFKAKLSQRKATSRRSRTRCSRSNSTNEPRS